jgi:antitoxin component of MazEF toxin-antitoxin module
MTQKVLKVGTSAAVTISKKALQELGIKPGDRVNVEVDKMTKTLTVQPAVSIDRELLDWTNSFIKRYRPVLDALAKK